MYVHISNQGVHTLNVELRYVVLKLRKKMQFFRLKENVFEEPYLDLEMSGHRTFDADTLKSVIKTSAKTAAVGSRATTSWQVCCT